jgi:transposase-like protein
MTQRVAVRPPLCPQCGGQRVDEYTHYECPPELSAEHRHWVCVTCDFEWILVDE